MSNPFASWTLAQVAERNARINAAKTPGMFQTPVPANAVTVERDLHEQIANHCKGKGWIALHGRMDMATGRTVGEPDFTILASASRVFFIECKTKTGKVSTEQNALIFWAQSLGHQVHVVRSFQQFLEVVK